MPTFAPTPTPPPLHGYRGEPTPGPVLQRPQGVTVAVSREAGARGGSIARRVGQRLGWQVFNQEMLGYLASDPTARRDLLTDVPPDAQTWANFQVARLIERRKLAPTDERGELIRLVFVLAARGGVVIVGRGAGFLLPVETTLNVRVVAPLPERVAYLGQWLRLTEPEAAAEVAARDRQRAELHRALADRDPTDLTQYDLVLNSGRLGEAAAAELVVSAARAKHQPDYSPDPTAVDPV
jgi:cytidylate kinase